MPLTEHQQQQLSDATADRVGALNGGPGTGKTYSAASFLDCGGEKMAVAPTGKASSRLTQSLRDAGIDITAKTIHSALRPTVDGGRWYFGYDRSNPLPCRRLLVDESSMIDTSLMASLLDAVPNDCRVLFLGDTNQLSPVGHGAPLRDMLSFVSHGRLSEVRRNAGNIVQSCHAMQSETEWGPGGNLQNLQVRSPHELVQLFAKDMQHRGYGIEDAQIVVPMNNKSPYSRTQLNAELQRQLNPHHDGRSAFALQDKVINTRNGWLLKAGPTSEDAITDSAGKIYVANGEMGTVVKVNQKSIVVELASPQRTVSVPLNEDGESLWQLGYAITVHRAQGSEWPLVFVVLDENAIRMCDRSWIYTAISRAKDVCVLAGNMELAYVMARRNRIDHRKTFLKELLEA